MNHRVVITGMAGVTSLGHDWQTIKSHFQAGKNAVQYLGEWDRFDGLNTRLAAPITDFNLPTHYTRKKIRSMGRVSLLSTRATELALIKAGLIDDVILTSGQAGIAYGSSTGSTQAILQFSTMMSENSTQNICATSYVQMMPHTTAVNTGLFFGLQGRVIPTSSACTSGSQAIGYAYEAIKHGYQTVMIAGGAEELCPSEAAVFDTLFATSQLNNTPNLTPKPFDTARDGLVIGEGAATLVLENYEHAKARGATIWGEIIGFHTNCDASHITQPKKETMQHCIQEALYDAQLPTSAIGYISAHGTATDRGDIAESHATHAIYGNQVPISSLKSYFGHTLGACGAIEAWLTLEMMHDKWYPCTLNLSDVDPRCGELDYIIASERNLDLEYTQSNNFAFGGINTSLIFKRL